MTSAKRFHSCLARQMERFVAIRRVTGRDYGSQTRNLLVFDRFLVFVHWTLPGLSRAVIEQYRLSRSHVATSAQRVSMSVVRQFCRHLAAFDRRSHVPDGIWTGDSVFHRLPFVFTKEQVQRLLAQAVALPPRHFPLRPLLYQTLFGLLYTTGIRIGEALALNIGDVDTESGRLLIRKGKFGKARWIPLSPTTGSRLATYLKERSQTSPAPKEAPVFISWRGERLSHRTANNNFLLFLKACGISRQNRAGPTIHSLRHYAEYRIMPSSLRSAA